ncbi:MarR family winged helix-turn-helix transcriptional regulator [Microbacterium sp. CJ88]|uniref:MarR family winged helix-turn-helix transcriptional regulator n=1 Tax=Microbacterium sp. CJ88 TaxID=3445672 RepID=UPI003F657BF8
MSSPQVSSDHRVARAVERLRLAEAGLARRRQTDCGPSENARMAMRYILERADAGEEVTPTAIAEHLEISTAAVTGILDRLHSGGLLSFTANPRDRRSKLVVPFDRSVDADDIDPLTAAIRDFAEDIPPSIVEEVAAFLEKVVAAVDDECR